MNNLDHRDASSPESGQIVQPAESPILHLALMPKNSSNPEEEIVRQILTKRSNLLRQDSKSEGDPCLKKQKIEEASSLSADALLAEKIQKQEDKK